MVGSIRIVGGSIRTDPDRYYRSNHDHTPILPRYYRAVIIRDNIDPDRGRIGTGEQL